jgi:hypothetical protein
MSDVDRPRPGSSEAQQVQQTEPNQRLADQQVFNNNQTGPYQQCEQQCTCGRCGACLAGIDLLHKEQRES